MTTIATGRRGHEKCEVCGDPATYVIREHPPLSGEGYLCTSHLPEAERRERKWTTSYTVEAL